MVSFLAVCWVKGLIDYESLGCLLLGRAYSDSERRIVLFLILRISIFEGCLVNTSSL